MEKIKTLLLGLGRIGQSLENDPLRQKPCTHFGTLQSSFGKRNFTLRGAFDSNPEKVQSFLADWKLSSKKVLTDWDDIQKERFDLCIIATSSDKHYDNAVFAIEQKIPNILIEKPACLQSAELKHLLQLKKKNRTKIWVNHERRYHPMYAYVKKCLDEKKYGEVVLVKAAVLTSGQAPGNAFVEYQNQPSGPLLHDGTHALDYIHWLLGKPERIQGKIIKAYKGARNETQALGFLTYPNDVHVFLEAGGYRKYFQFEIDIQTTEARFVLSNDGHRFYVTDKSKLYKGFKSLREQPLPKIAKSQASPWINLYKEIAAVVQKKQKEQRGTLEDNLEILEMIEGIYRGDKTAYSFLS